MPETPRNPDSLAGNHVPPTGPELVSDLEAWIREYPEDRETFRLRETLKELGRIQADL